MRLLKSHLMEEYLQIYLSFVLKHQPFEKTSSLRSRDGDSADTCPFYCCRFGVSVSICLLPEWIQANLLSEITWDKTHTRWQTNCCCLSIWVCSGPVWTFQIMWIYPWLFSDWFWLSFGIKSLFNKLFWSRSSNYHQNCRWRPKNASQKHL